MSSSLSLPSDRSFGFTFVAVFGLIAAWLLWTGRPGGLAVIALAVTILVITLLRPAWLRPLNRSWMRFAKLLHSVVSPLVLGAVYFLLIAPVGIGMRLFGRDALNRRFVRSQRSYWIERDPPGPPPSSLKNQF